MPIPRPRAASAWLVALALLAAACSQPATTGQGPATTGPPGLAAGALPAGCPGAAPPPAAAPVAFAAGGRAWAASVDGRQVWCLFEVADPGPFLWGPRGDRVALAGLEVRGVGAAVARPPLEIAPLSLAWTGAAGAGLAFVAPGGLNLEVAGLGSDDLRELTPLRDVSYRAVAAHPSGAALAFAVDRAGGGEIWLSNSDGGGAVRLAAGVAGDPLAFSSAGTVLYAGVREPDGSRRIDAWSLGDGRRLPPAWTGRRDVRAILPGPDAAGGALAIDVGSGCGDRQAILTAPGGGAGRPLLPQVTRPTGVVGWLDGRRVLVAEGGCDGRLDLWAVDAAGARQPTPVVKGVARAAVRRSIPPPPPPDLAHLAHATR